MNGSPETRAAQGGMISLMTMLRKFHRAAAFAPAPRALEWAVAANRMSVAFRRGTGRGLT
jgi:hypothetical protein